LSFLGTERGFGTFGKLLGKPRCEREKKERKKEKKTSFDVLWD